MKIENKNPYSIRFFLSQMRIPFKYLILFFGPALLLLLGVALQNNVPRWTLMFDQFTVLKTGGVMMEPYAGFISNCGVILWCCTIGICFFAAGLYKKLGHPYKSSFFLYSGIIVSLLMIDDFFMLHDYIFPEKLGLPEKAVYGFYFVAVLLWLYKFRYFIIHSQFLFLVIAFGGFGFSIIADIMGQIGLPSNYFIEDSAKFLGIVSFLAYFSLTALNELYVAYLIPTTQKTI